MTTRLPFRFGDTIWELGQQTRIMGILNVTPDSFSDGGRFVAHEAAVEHAVKMIADGADIIDIGGESTRPGAAEVTVEAEMDRVVPVIKELARRTDTPISIDTSKAAVAAAALAAGATIVNDVSGFHRDPEMARVTAEAGAGCVLMHMRGTPGNMQKSTEYEDLIGDICAYFRETVELALAAGVRQDGIVLDPGIGFAKTAEQNLVLIDRLDAFRELGCPVLMGPSRKSFIGALLPGSEPHERVWGTAASIACCIMRGADIVRVHDVREMKEVAVVADAIRNSARQ